MKKTFIFIFILLLIVLGLLFCVKKTNNFVKENRQSNMISDVSGNGLRINFLDVGQGDASLINFPDNEQMLVDCSEDARILEALGRSMNFYDNEIDYLVVTHPDYDHYGGCEDVLNKFKVKNIVYTGYKKTGDSAWDSFFEKFTHNPDLNYIKIDHEQTLSIASTSLHFLYPNHSLEVDDKIPNSKEEANTNDTSIVFELNYKDKEVLFTGDMGSDLESYLLSNYNDVLNTDILKVGHHGSSYSSGQEFLNMVTPEHSIISVGENNKFGHPSSRILKKLERTGTQIMRTDLNGDVECSLGTSVVCK